MGGLDGNDGPIEIHFIDEVYLGTSGSPCSGRRSKCGNWYVNFRTEKVERKSKEISQEGTEMGHRGTSEIQRAFLPQQRWLKDLGRDGNYHSAHPVKRPLHFSLGGMQWRAQ